MNGWAEQASSRRSARFRLFAWSVLTHTVGGLAGESNTDTVPPGPASVGDGGGAAAATRRVPPMNAGVGVGVGHQSIGI